MEEKRKPESIILPHLIKGNFVLGEPTRPHLVRLGDLAPEGIGGENMDFQSRRIVDEMKEKTTRGM